MVNKSNRNHVDELSNKGSKDSGKANQAKGNMCPLLFNNFYRIMRTIPYDKVTSAVASRHFCHWPG